MLIRTSRSPARRLPTIRMGVLLPSRAISLPTGKLAFTAHVVGHMERRDAIVAENRIPGDFKPYPFLHGRNKTGNHAIAFYEKVIKVKADVAAYLINCFPSPSPSGGDVGICQGRPAGTFIWTLDNCRWPRLAGSAARWAQRICRLARIPGVPGFRNSFEYRKRLPAPCRKFLCRLRPHWLRGAESFQR